MNFLFGSGGKPAAPLQSKNIRTKQDISSLIKQTDKPILTHWNQGHPLFVLFFMPTCIPCQETVPQWEQLTDLPQEAMVLQVDTDTQDSFLKELGDSELHNTLTQHLQTSGYPTAIHLQKGRPFDKDLHPYNGSRKTDDFKKWILGKISKQSDSKQSDNKQSGGKQSGGKQSKKMTRKNNKTRKNKKRKSKSNPPVRHSQNVL